MNIHNPYDTGRIGQIISFLKEKYQNENISSLSAEIKLAILCDVLQLDATEFDSLIAYNSPVIRTVKGHCFETVFDYIIKHNGCDSIEIGGDDGRDRIVNGVTLQLKTLYIAGTTTAVWQFKTHKTHGSKSEAEGEHYYHSVDSFADYFVGHISYDPFQVIFIPKEGLQTHKTYSTRITSPFKIKTTKLDLINRFDLIGIESVRLDAILPGKPGEELLPLASQLIGLSTEIILDTIISSGNFRVWDMNMRGFARELAFKRLLREKHVTFHEPTEFRAERANKADIVLIAKNGEPKFMQMKGLTVSACQFGSNPIVAVETQLTRGRVNDHPTQSRLYATSDFDVLLIAIDPSITQKLHHEMGENKDLAWEFYAVPSSILATHPVYSGRFKSIQKFDYRDLQRFLIDDNWLLNWV